MKKKIKYTYGFYDFRFSPYALGDNVTWMENLLIRMILNSSDKISLNFFVDKKNPSSRYQKHINSYNFYSYFNNLFPVYTHLPNLAEINVIDDNIVWNKQILKSLKWNNNSWPNFINQMTNEFDFSSHNQINQYYRKFKKIPKLQPNKLYIKELAPILKKRLVAVNFRQSNLSNSPNNSHRDSDNQNWFRFFKYAQTEYKNILFILLGEINRYTRSIISLENVLSLRGLNYHLGHEMSLILSGVPFIGTSSGFGAIATFSNSSYVILNFEHKSSKYVELKIGQNYPFASNNQKIIWEYDNYDKIINSFKSLINND